MFNFFRKTGKSPVASVCSTVRTLYSYIYVRLAQCLNRTVRVHDKNTVQVSYALGSRLYHIRIKHKRTPSMVTRVTEEERDITDKIRSYLGPNEDWHGHTYTPCDLGCKTIRFEFMDDTYQDFDPDEIIQIWDAGSVPNRGP